MAEVMLAFRYRGTDSQGKRVQGQIDAASKEEAVRRLRQSAILPIDVSPGAAAAPAGAVKRTGKTRQAITRAIGELAVLLNAGIALERAMTLMLDSVEDAALRAELAKMQQAVKEGAPLSRTMTERAGLFPPMAPAMAEAGEADGKLGAALERLADALQRDDDLRSLIVTAMIYPIILVVLSVAVIAMMLLFVVPQFESLFAGAADRLPAASRFIMQASQTLRSDGWWMVLVLIAAGLGVRQMLRQPQARAARDRWILGVPQIGSLVRAAETARFARHAWSFGGRRSGAALGNAAGGPFHRQHPHGRRGARGGRRHEGRRRIDRAPRRRRHLPEEGDRLLSARVRRPRNWG